MNKVMVILLIISMYSNKLFSQSKNVDIKEIVKFNDTIKYFLADSLVIDFGYKTKSFREIIRYFKYIGNDTVLITSTYTSDPHFISECPREPLVKNKIYKFKISMWPSIGPCCKHVGLRLSNGQTIDYLLRGEFIE